MSFNDPVSTASGSWSELFNRHHRTAVVVMAGGIALFAVNVYVTTSLLPNAVEDIGGGRFYAWAMTTFLVASVFSSMLVSRLLGRRGPRRAYEVALALFTAGSVAAAAAPTMPVLLAGRTLQGLGGGLLAGLAYAVVRQVLPERLWKRAFGLVSAMWGLGNVIGPIVGGLFAGLGLWRFAFVLLAAGSVALAWLARRSLAAATDSHRDAQPVPFHSLVLVALATGAISIASIVDSPVVSGALIAVAVALVLQFVLHERRASVRVLPAVTYRSGSPLKWIYLSLAVLAVGSTTEAFIPLFGQRLAAMSPLAAGLLGASLSWGWSVAQIATSGITRRRAVDAVRVLGPLLLAVGLLAYGVLQASGPGAVRVALWFVVLFVAGSGIGMAFGNWIPAAMASTPDPEESDKAAAGINTVQLIANAFGSAVAGVLVDIGGPETLGSARTLSVGYAALAGLGIVIAVHAVRAGRDHREPANARA